MKLSHSIAAVFFGAGHLNELEGTVPASNPDSLSGEMIRFQQGLRFMGEAARGRGAKSIATRRGPFSRSKSHIFRDRASF
jgi:hypothetical protein